MSNREAGETPARRNNVWITAEGQTRTQSEWARLLGCKPQTIHRRIRIHGWPPALAVTTPVGSRRPSAVPDDTRRLAVTLSRLADRYADGLLRDAGTLDRMQQALDGLRQRHARSVEVIG